MRRRKNKRAYFTQTKAHPKGPSCSVFRGWRDDEECKGFDERELKISEWRAEETRQRYEEHSEVLRPFQCISFALSHSQAQAPFYVYQVKMPEASTKKILYVWTASCMKLW